MQHGFSCITRRFSRFHNISSFCLICLWLEVNKISFIVITSKTDLHVSIPLDTNIYLDNYPPIHLIESGLKRMLQ